MTRKNRMFIAMGAAFFLMVASAIATLLGFKTTGTVLLYFFLIVHAVAFVLVTKHLVRANVAAYKRLRSGGPLFDKDSEDGDENASSER